MPADALPKLAAILNLTPDSFSDGGRHNQADVALARVDRLIADGADVIDVGAESTRPGATALTAEEEWERLQVLLPNLLSLCHQHRVPLSLDTRHAATADKALKLGVDWINDVSGLADPAMLNVLKGSQCNYVLMHSMSVPVNPTHQIPADADPVAFLLTWAQARLSVLKQAGIAPHRILFDPGLGFGKSAEQSINIMQRISKFSELDVPLFVGHSRKSFLKKFSEAFAEDRDIESLAAAVYLAQPPVAYLRVHNLAAHIRFLKTWAGLKQV